MLTDLIVVSIVFAIVMGLVNLALTFIVLWFCTSKKFGKLYMKRLKKFTETIEEIYDEEED